MAALIAITLVATRAVCRGVAEDATGARLPLVTTSVRHLRFSSNYGTGNGSATLIDGDAQPAGTLTLTGTVLGLDGRPAPAQVVLESSPPRVAIADGGGQFSFSGLAPRSYIVRAASHDACGVAVLRVSVNAQSVTVRLRPCVNIMVAVVDATRLTPIAGARVSIGHVSATTSQAGDARLGPLRPGRAYVAVSAAGYANVRIPTIVTSSASNSVDVRLEAGFSVAGVVKDARGFPVEFARVYALDDLSIPVTDGEPDAMTDVYGRFEVTAVSLGIHRLVALDAVHASARTGPLAVSSDLGDVILVMGEGGLLQGVVVDETGSPVSDATVYVGSAGIVWGMKYSRETTTGRDGRFALYGLDRDRLYVRAERGRTASDMQVIDLSRSKYESVELRLQATDTIAGTVLDEFGRPCGHAVVNAMIHDGTNATLTSVTADEDGQYVVSDLPRGRYLLWAGVVGEDRAIEDAYADAGDTGVMLTCSASGGMRGEVVLESTSGPPADALIIISGMNGHARSAYRTQGSGDFEFDGLPPDVYQVRIRGPDFVDKRVEAAVVMGRISDLGQIVVSRGVSVAGTVVDDADESIVGARIYVGKRPRGIQYVEPDRPWYRLSGAGGYFMVSGLQSGASYVLAATKGEKCSSMYEVTPSQDAATALRLALSTCGSIIGTVVRGGVPMVGALVAIGDPEFAAATTDEEGAFAFIHVPMGVTSVRVFEAASFVPLFSTTIRTIGRAPTQVTLDVSGQ